MLRTIGLSHRVDQKFLIQDISLSFSPGILYGILGPNGSGKSSLLKTLAGIWRASSGKVLWNEENLHQKERREISKIISLVPAHLPLHFNYSAEEIVSMGRYPHSNALKSRDKEIIAEAFDLVNAQHLRHRPIYQLSSGERQRIFIARSLVTESSVLLLDEPTSSLDVRHQIEIWKLLQKLTLTKFKIVIAATHDLIACERYCCIVTLMSQGRSLISGSFSTIKTQIDQLFSHC